MRHNWEQAFFAPAMLMLEAQQVIALRMMKLAMGGPAAATEASRMIEEKMTATASAATTIATALTSLSPDGGTGAVVTMLRRRVRANRRRLLR